MPHRVVHKLPLSMPSFSTPVKQWDNGNFPCCFLLYIYFLFHGNLFGFGGFLIFLETGDVSFKMQENKSLTQLLYTNPGKSIWVQWIKLESHLLSHCCHISLCGSIIMWCISAFSVLSVDHAMLVLEDQLGHKHQPQIWGDKEISLVMMFVFLKSFDSEDKVTATILDLHRTNYHKFILFYKAVDYTT